MTKQELAEVYTQFCFGEGSGLGRFVCSDMHEEVHQQLSDLENEPITKVQLNQLLVISECGSISDGFFKYYWKSVPKHTYDVSKLEFYDEAWITSDKQEIVSHDHMRWGLNRIYIDGLLYFGNVVAGFNSLRSFSFEELEAFFGQKRFDTAAISARGPALPLRSIAKDDRYLISEMACKTFGEVPEDADEAKRLLLDELNAQKKKGATKVKFKDLLKQLSIRDTSNPTMSAAKGHEDKGLIECLMVKCAKVLVYCEGEKESYGKDAEAAIALSLGKPVIFYCDQGRKTNSYRDVHPLSRLIDFRSGVAVGAIVTADAGQVAELLKRIFENKMEYRIEHHEKRPGYLKLIECLTDSVVRLQTDDDLLSTTFWNNYHNRRRDGFMSLAAGKEAERLQE